MKDAAIHTETLPDRVKINCEIHGKTFLYKIR